MMKDFFNPYSLKARVPPALLVVVFANILYWIYYKHVFNISTSGIEIAFETALSVGLLFILASFIRSIGKFLIERKMFGGEIAMPTTQTLLNPKESNLSAQKIEELYSYIHDDLEVDLTERKKILAGEPQEIKKEVDEVITKIRDRTRSDAFLLHANIQYGLWRNITGASIIVIVISIATIGFDCTQFGGKNFSMLVWFVVGSLLLFFTGLCLTKSLAKVYSKRLFDAYILTLDQRPKIE